MHAYVGFIILHLNCELNIGGRTMRMYLGELEIDGVIYDRNTSVDMVLCSPQFHPYVNSNGAIDLFTADQVVVDGYSFKVKVFFLNKSIEKIQLFPINIGIKDPGYPDKKYQDEKKKVVDSFLRAKLGEPLKENDAVLYYEFEWGSISSVAFLSGRNEYTGGFIEFSYNQK